MTNSKYNVIDRLTFPREMPERTAATVNFSPVTGAVYFSKRACEIMGLHDGDKVVLLQGKDDALTLGFKVVKDDNGFKIHPKRVGQVFTSHKLVRMLLAQFGRSRPTTVQLATEPEDGVFWVLRGSIDRRSWG